PRQVYFGDSKKRIRLIFFFIRHEIVAMDKSEAERKGRGGEKQMKDKEARPREAEGKNSVEEKLILHIKEKSRKTKVQTKSLDKNGKFRNLTDSLKEKRWDFI